MTNSVHGQASLGSGVPCASAGMTVQLGPPGHASEHGDRDLPAILVPAFIVHGAPSVLSAAQPWRQGEAWPGQGMAGVRCKPARSPGFDRVLRTLDVVRAAAIGTVSHFPTRGVRTDLHRCCAAIRYALCNHLVAHATREPSGPADAFPPFGSQGVAYTLWDGEPGAFDPRLDEGGGRRVREEVGNRLEPGHTSKVATCWKEE